MKVQCAWCGRRISGPDEHPVVSHGICQDCHDKMLAREAISSRVVEIDLASDAGWECDLWRDFGEEAGGD